MRMISGLVHQSYTFCLPNEQVCKCVLISLHPDDLTVFDKMTQEQDKLKCCNVILTCREYWRF